jgi:hypothetical protein
MDVIALLTVSMQHPYPPTAPLYTSCEVSQQKIKIVSLCRLAFRQWKEKIQMRRKSWTTILTMLTRKLYFESRI